VLNHGFRKHSGRVGRTSTITLSEKVLLAIIAHARHRHTGYGALLNSGKQRQVARKAMREDVDCVLQRWRRTQAAKKKKAIPKKTKAEDIDDAEFVDE
jgi:hypothetical protein